MSGKQIAKMALIALVAVAAANRIPQLRGIIGN